MSRSLLSRLLLIAVSVVASFGLTPQLSPAKAADFSIQTGYYMGSGATQAITGLGFQPQFVLIKSETTAGQPIWKSSAMAASTAAYLAATADDATTQITLTATGFTLGTAATVNSANVRYSYVAFAGSDCTASGTFCVGTYTGTGTATRAITTGFQPAFVMTKRSTNTAAVFRTSTMATNVGNYFITTAESTNGALFTSLDATGFTVGSTNNTNGGTYYYVAFKAVAGVMATGSYTGNGTDNRDITGFGVGATPNMVLLKNTSSGTAANRQARMSLTDLYGDHAHRLDSAAATTVNTVQALATNGFQVGTDVTSNESGATVHWIAFGGEAAVAGSGTYQMAQGSYTGNGSAQSISGLGFSPSLVLIKDASTNYQVFRTSLMKGDSSGYLGNAVANFAGGITSLDAAGFTVGANAGVNTNASTYYYQAFGNAYSPETNTGASTFAIGTYTGNGIDQRDISRLPFQPAFVAIKRNSTTAGAWRSTAHPADTAGFFAAAAETTLVIRSFATDSFRIGTNAATNTAASVYYWFAFVDDATFSTGSYTGNGTTQSVNVGFQPNLIYVKRSTAVRGIQRTSTIAGDNAQPFINGANFTGAVTGIVATGYTTGSATETNANTGTYRYVAWKIPVAPVVSISITSDGTVNYGAVATGSSKTTLSGELNDTQIATNDGNVTENFTIKGADTACPWSLSGASGTDAYKHEFSTNGGGNWNTLTTNYQSLASSVAVAGTASFDLRITVPTVSSCYTEQDATVTVQASE
jgi:hypothetical protein